MTSSRTIFHVILGLLIAGSLARAQQREIPEVLEPWKSWVLWGEQHPDCPTPFNTSEQHICAWPSRLTLSADQEKGSWQVQVQVFEQAWVALPGSAQTWPFNVRVNDEPFPVVEHHGAPALRLPAGRHELAGEFLWSPMPQRIAIPKQIGILSLVVEGEAVTVPNWDASGHVWLKRVQAEAEAKDLLTVQVYRAIEDGIPLWLRTEIDLTVSGKSREEQLGAILPEGWQLSFVESPIPVAVDDDGIMRAQVRAGNWKVQVHAFRNTEVDEVRFADGAEPLTNVELIGFRIKPDFRIAELEGLLQLDVSQTTYPSRWRELPVFEWKTDTTFQLIEKMRGLGQQRPRGLTIYRHFWLDEDGRGVTYRDRISGKLQQIWRLDVADDQDLGAVRVDGERQLITANPNTGAHGVEIRNRNPKLEAIGRITSTNRLSATGWQTDAESLSIKISLPPGWRVFALFGADRVQGDWLTAWSLLDLFLVLIFSLAVFRLWGIRAGIIALLAFGLSYHEPGAPRLTWLFLLMPIALLRVVTAGSGKSWLNAWRYIAVALLLLSFVPFAARQIQSAIYPQLETTGTTYRPRDMFDWFGFGSIIRSRSALSELEDTAPASGKVESVQPDQTNLLFDPKARIQTGPAVPNWDWNQVYCSWNGPVSSDQPIVPILISRPLHRVLTVARLALLFLLAAIIFGVRLTRIPLFRRRATTAVVMLILLPTGAAFGQVPGPSDAGARRPTLIPGQQMLNTLRERLLEPSDAYPRAAEITSVDLKLDEGQIAMTAEVHAAIDVAVPLPGRLPAWSPVSVRIDEQPEALVCRRDDGYLWVTVPQGVHQIVIEGWLAEATEWEWTFLLPPRRVSIDAPGWEVTGVRANGVPESQVLFARPIERTEGEATYDQKNFHAIAAVDRRLEIGLLWKVQTTVTRLSEPGKAVSLKVPLLSGESVLTSNVVVNDGAIEVNLGANQANFTWESELASAAEVKLDAVQTDQWVEGWHLMTSPVWNVSFTGLEPIYEISEETLIPVWRPWPGEDVTLEFRQPRAVSGETVTVQAVQHKTMLGARQRDAQLVVEVESSLGTDFVIQFEADAKAEISALKVDGRSNPARFDGTELIVPLRTGKQTIDVTWKSPRLLHTVVPVADVTLPVAGANVETVMVVPENRWILWANGPLRGPAVRFWTIVVFAVLAAVALGGLSLSPLRRIEWVLLMLGLTQVHVAAAMLVVGWLFLLAWRGKRSPEQMGRFRFNLLQVWLVVFTLIVLGIFIVVVGEGLLGNPEMFIVGNRSSRTYLNWFEPLTGPELPTPYIVSISVWFYRLLMLFWALWLATALLRWLKNGWLAFSNGGCWKRKASRRPPLVADVVES